MRYCTILFLLLLYNLSFGQKKHVIERHPNGQVYEEYDMIVTETKQMRVSTADIWDKTLGNYEIESGLIDGEYKRYYENGQLEVHCFFVMNVHTGPFRTYFDTGELERECIYDKGKLAGPLTRYNKDGSVFEVTTPFDGGYYYEVHLGFGTTGKGTMDKSRLFQSFEYSWNDDQGIAWVETYSALGNQWHYDDYFLSMQKGSHMEHFMDSDFESRSAEGNYFKKSAKKLEMKAGEYFLTEEIRYYEPPKLTGSEKAAQINLKASERINYDDYGDQRTISLYKEDSLLGEVKVIEIWTNTYNSGVARQYRNKGFGVIYEVIEAVEEALEVQRQQSVEEAARNGEVIVKPREVDIEAFFNGGENQDLRNGIEALYTKTVNLGSTVNSIPVKKKITEAAFVLWDDYEEQRNADAIYNLYNLLVELKETNTREIEKKLKSVDDPQGIEKLLFEPKN